MFCPKCGQRQLTDEVRFCSSCGFALNVVSDVLAGGGQLRWMPTPPPPQGLTPRQKGLRQGAMLMLSTLLVVPIVIFLGVATLHLPGQLIPLAAVICIFGGLLRILHALLFEEGPPRAGPYIPASYAPPAAAPYLEASRASALPPARSAPVPAYRPRYNTGELAERPPSVTENTTRLLDRQPDDPSGK